MIQAHRDVRASTDRPLEHVCFDKWTAVRRSSCASRFPLRWKIPFHPRWPKHYRGRGLDPSSRGIKFHKSNPWKLEPLLLYEAFDRTVLIQSLFFRFENFHIFAENLSRLAPRVINIGMFFNSTFFYLTSFIYVIFYYKICNYFKII